ncbi:hypothetical protein J1605_013946 [Eschrichtius robustus]|uniref:Epiplakin n=1 Tax=Eschrichtius robustus TaxID=9764 RepID=A0AB34GGY6_ESCRO|nr:hypothetical protein J1605_013946 [Eschrichtius robustus]
MYEQLERGRTMAQDMGSLASVQRYLRGTGCIAGLLLPSSQEPLSIHEACRKGLLRPGTALTLLEAQAATGFITERKRGAMKKDLIVREHGIRLLEAQIATGGVVDPVHGRRLPMDVAYRRGYFDEEMNHVLEDPSDDTKGFFDPNLQLLECCVRDPNTGLYVLQVVKKGETYREKEERACPGVQSPELSLEQLLEIIPMTVKETEKQNQVIKVAAIGGGVTAAELFNSGIIGVATPSTQEVMSIYEASRKGLIPVGFAAQLLEAQVATGFMLDPHGHQRLSVDEAMAAGLTARGAGGHGGIVDPLHHHRLPLDTAYRRSCLDQNTYPLAEEQKCMHKRFVDLNTQEKGTYQELQERGHREEGMDWALVPRVSGRRDSNFINKATRRALKAERVDVTVGRFKGQRPSVWELLNSEYLTEDKKRELVVKYKRDTAHALEKGVKRYLEGTSCIAGMLVPAKDEPRRQEKSIYQAMWKVVLRPGTALVLLEAQAATGFVINPVENRKLTVQEAFAAGMFSSETYQKLLSAKRSVTGYTDPYTGEQISLFQAVKKDLIVREHGIRLLEAQIATGGVIDPMRSRHLPVDVAYRHGYFNKGMNRVLEDPSDNTKGFFNPNTHENFTYVQLLQRATPDPETGLLFLLCLENPRGDPRAERAARGPLHAGFTPTRAPGDWAGFQDVCGRSVVGNRCRKYQRLPGLGRAGRRRPLRARGGPDGPGSGPPRKPLRPGRSPQAGAGAAESSESREEPGWDQAAPPGGGLGRGGASGRGPGRGGRGL